MTEARFFHCIKFIPTLPRMVGYKILDTGMYALASLS